MAADGNGRDHAGRFAKGGPGGPGRKKGSIAVMSELIKVQILESWDKYGAKVLKVLAERRPAEYARLIAAILPREDTATVSLIPQGDLHSSTCLKILADLQERVGGSPTAQQVIEELNKVAVDWHRPEEA